MCHVRAARCVRWLDAVRASHDEQLGRRRSPVRVRRRRGSSGSVAGGHERSAVAVAFSPKAPSGRQVRGEDRVLEVDQVVICAGQVSRNELQEPLEAAGVQVHVIGGAERAGELDARRAFDQGTRLAAAF